MPCQNTPDHTVSREALLVALCRGPRTCAELAFNLARPYQDVLLAVEAALAMRQVRRVGTGHPPVYELARLDYRKTQAAYEQAYRDGVLRELSSLGALTGNVLAANLDYPLRAVTGALEDLESQGRVRRASADPDPVFAWWELIAGD